MTDPRADPSQKPTVQMPSEGQRALARAIVGEMLPEMRSMIREEVANAVLDHHERIRKLETRVETLEESKGDVTGRHNVDELRERMLKAEARYQRKLQIEQMRAVADRAVQRAEQDGLAGWMRRYGWKAIGAAMFAAWNAFLLWWSKHK